MIRSITIAALLLSSPVAMAADWVAISPDRCVTTRGAAVTAAQNESYSIKSKSNTGFGSALFSLCVRKNGVYHLWQFAPVGTKFCRTARRQLGTSLDSNGNCPSAFP
jgi:hypothetical protein